MSICFKVDLASNSLRRTVLIARVDFVTVKLLVENSKIFRHNVEDNELIK